MLIKIGLDKFMRKNTLVILGNGFDLDIGLPTSYNAFVESDDFKKILALEPVETPGRFKNEITRDIGIMHCIEKEKERENWIDLEMFLTQYAKEGRINIARNEKLINCPNISQTDIVTMYNNLMQSLYAYLSTIPYTNIKNTSNAAKLMRQIAKNPHCEIWSFNYTDLNRLCKLLNLDNIQCKVTHVHGSLKENNIILGFHNDAKVDSSYSYMKKMENPNHSFSGYITKLINADNIIIFGHSFGETDKDYFTAWLNFAAETIKRQNIIIYTKDDYSKAMLFKRINEMTSNRLHEIKGRNRLTVYTSV